jgi:hypothetical protein
MANEEQLSILKQGIEVWNKWRDENSYVDVHLTTADLSFANLNKANLRRALLTGANLEGAMLKETDFTAAELSRTDFTHANLNGALLIGANLNRALLRDAVLNKANLGEANLGKAFLSGSDLSEADLRLANLSGIRFFGSNFTKARVGGTNFGNSDLSEAIGLEHVVHLGPSIISRRTFARSKGKIPDVFLRGCGLSDWEVEIVKLYDPNVSHNTLNEILYKIYDLRSAQAIQISPLFISYSHADSAFVDKLGHDFNRKGIRFWRDIHDMKAGRLEKQIDRAIRQNPTVLLVLSEHSLSSDWVEHEVRTARQLEKDLDRDVLCPVALDDSWKNSSWPKRVMEQIMEYNILDFSAWRDDSKFDSMFRRLIDGLELFYKG